MVQYWGLYAKGNHYVVHCVELGDVYNVQSSILLMDWFKKNILFMPLIS